MLYAAFLWLLNRGIGLGIIVLCLLPIRALFRKKVPRVFSYLLWSALPLNVLLNLCLRFIPVKVHRIIDHTGWMPHLIIPEHILHVMTCVWICVTVVIGTVLVGSYIVFLRHLVGSIRFKENIYISERLEAPFSLGLFHPKIYLPTSLVETQYEPVLLHEQVHVARKDIWAIYLSVVLIVAFWFQPLLWLAYKMFIDDMEEACDETVLGKRDKSFRKEYARAIVEVAYQAGKVWGLAVGYSSGKIEKRVNHILQYEKAGTRICRIALVTCIVFSVAAIPISLQIPRVLQTERSDGSAQKSLSIKESELYIKVLPVDE